MIGWGRSNSVNHKHHNTYNYAFHAFHSRASNFSIRCVDFILFYYYVFRSSFWLFYAAYIPRVTSMEWSDCYIHIRMHNGKKPAGRLSENNDRGNKRGAVSVRLSAKLWHAIKLGCKRVWAPSVHFLASQQLITAFHSRCHLPNNVNIKRNQEPKLLSQINSCVCMTYSMRAHRLIRSSNSLSIRSVCYISSISL